MIENLYEMGDPTGESVRAAKPDHVYLDCMGFGMGCSCLQMTFQACNIDEACHLYDQLTALTPIVVRGKGMFVVFVLATGILSYRCQYSTNMFNELECISLILYSLLHID